MSIVNSSLSDGISVFLNFVANHKSQLELSGIPSHYWEVLCKKLNGKIFDAGNTFTILKYEYEGGREQHQPVFRVEVSSDVNCRDPCHIFLIDHAWTYSANIARQHLREVPGLLERMANLMDVTEPNVTHQELIDIVFNEMWRYNLTYSIGGHGVPNIEDSLPVWYIMDEFGSAIQHSDEPNFRTVPFVHLPEQVAYTILFPIENVSKGDEVTRDFVEGQYEDPSLRTALLLPWQPHSFVNQDFNQYEPDENYFLAGHIRETLPNLDCVDAGHIDDKVVLKVYSEYSFINDYLTHSSFEIVDNESDADILWYTKHFKSYQELSEHCPWKFVNQFPFENVITVKDLLVIISRRKHESNRMCYDPENLETFPAWLPTSYNLKTEMSQFVSYFQHRTEKNLNNHWIVKPYNLARGLDMHITDNINFILKLFFTRPKIVQKYIDRPVLFNRPEIGLVKFDIRYVILLKSVTPLEVYVYRHFFLRFANHKFELCDFDDYEKHYTVMNYQSNVPLCRLLCHEFIKEFENQYPEYSWKDIEVKIFSMLSEVFVSATRTKPPCGIAHSPQSRAVYAADIMLEWSDDKLNLPCPMQPKLLEINWTPDCKRACEYYPDFYNDIFSLLFLGKKNDEVFEKLEDSQSF